MAVKYGEFKFPSEKGFTGSAGKTMVSAYARGGAVKKADGGIMSMPEPEGRSGSEVQPDREMVNKTMTRRMPPKMPGVRSDLEAEVLRRVGPGVMSDREARMLRRGMGMKTGGAVHEDVAMDKKLVKQMVKPAAMKAKGGAVHEDAAMDRAMLKKMVKPSAMKAKGGKVGC